MTKSKMINPKYYIIIFIIFFIHPLFLISIIELLTHRGIKSLIEFYITNNFLINYFLISISFIPVLLSYKRKFFFVLINIVWLILGVSNNIILKLRGTPLNFNDFLMLKYARELSVKYLSLTEIILITFVLTLTVFILIYIFINEIPKYTNYKFNLILMLLILFTFAFIFSKTYSEESDIFSSSNISDKFEKNGFVFSFIDSCFGDSQLTHDNYSENSVENIISSINKNYNSNISKSISSPSDINVIFVQLESFFDPYWVKSTQYSTDPIPYFRKLSKDFTSGTLISPTYGGGTANVEFEVLTELPIRPLDSGACPFMDIVNNKEIPSIADVFKNNNYSVHAIHNHFGDFYSRKEVYENLGFDSFTPVELMKSYDLTNNWWAKNTILVPCIKELLTSTDNADFIYTITVQCHGPYPNDIESNGIYTVNSTSLDIDKNSFDYYLNELNQTDNFIKDLLKTLNSMDEKFIVAFYGDHLPEIGLDSNNLSTENKMLTPFLLWDNIGLTKEEINIPAAKLASYIFNKINMDGSLISKLYDSNNTNSKYSDLKTLEYDVLYGENYLLSYYKRNTNKYSIGIKDIVINSIKKDKGIYILSGGKFNSYSCIYINDVLINTIYIDENTLTFNYDNLSSNDSIIVKQCSKDKKIIYKSSNFYKYN